MAYKGVVRFDARCPKHIRFNPENGPGAIKAGCQFCQQLVELYQAVQRVKRLAAPLAKPRKVKDATPE